MLRETKEHRENRHGWRIWVDTKERIVSFHEKEGWQLLEFKNHDLFIRCVDEYAGRQFRYQ